MTDAMVHGRRSTYGKGCRCDECKAANNQEAREYNRRRKLGLVNHRNGASEAGRRGGRKRWAEHVPAVVSLHGLTEDQRAFIAATVQAMKENRLA